MDKSGEIAPPLYYNSRLLNQFKKLLKEKEIHFIWHNKPKMLVLDQYYLVIYPGTDGRFYAYNKLHWPKISFSFTANSDIELIVKLLRFKLIPHTVARDLAKEEKFQKRGSNP